jgi:hypothetical protein
MARVVREISTVIRVALFLAGLIAGGWLAERAVNHCPALLVIVGTACMFGVVLAVLVIFGITHRG